MNDAAVPETTAPVNPPSYSGMPPAPLPRVNVARLATARALSQELLRLAEIVWRQRGLALIDPLTLQEDAARQQVITEANRLYGRRRTLPPEAK